MIIIIILIIIVLTLLFPVSRAFYVRLGRIIYDSSGRTNYKVYNNAVVLGGIRQAIQFKEGNQDTDILLVIHGGPGWSETAISYSYQKKLVDKYLIVNWDQRCVGQTALLSGYKSDEVLSMETIISDGVELVEYLKNKFPEKKLFIMGHSWGSVLGSIISSRHPELVDGYIGWGQVVNLVDEEAAVFNHTMELAQNKGDTVLLKKLETLMPYPVDEAGNVVFTEKLSDFTSIKYDCGYGSIRFHDLQSFTKENIIWAIENPYYKLKAIKWIGNEEPYEYVLRNDFKVLNISNLAPCYKMPVAFIYGDNDWQTPFTVGREYYESITAPIKEFYLVKNAGHSTTFDNEDDFVSLLRGPVFELMHS